MKKASIKPGTFIYQDFGFYKWPECADKQPAMSDTVFNVLEVSPGLFDLITNGFGDPVNYGNGQIRVDGTEHLIFYGEIKST
jgi:hypothetical protein